MSGQRVRTVRHAHAELVALAQTDATDQAELQAAAVEQVDHRGIGLQRVGGDRRALFQHRVRLARVDRHLDAVLAPCQQFQLQPHRPRPGRLGIGGAKPGMPGAAGLRHQRVHAQPDEFVFGVAEQPCRGWIGPHDDAVAADDQQGVGVRQEQRAQQRTAVGSHRIRRRLHALDTGGTRM